VHQTRRAVKIPVIGLGGVQKPEDVLEYIVVGASAVQVGTANYVDPRATLKLVDGLRNLCLKEKINNINNLRAILIEDLC
jgi:dihydroorotate dehydrogenase (NAD+) catalytic subunit